MLQGSRGGALQIRVPTHNALRPLVTLVWLYMLLSPVLSAQPNKTRQNPSTARGAPQLKQPSISIEGTW